MKRLCTFPTITEAHLLMGILEAARIEVVVRNEHLSGLAGSVPFVDAWPQVWVVHDDEFIRAQAILDEYQASPPGQPPP